MDRYRALLLLSECRGDEIWSIEHCQRRGVPQTWIDELQDAFESGFQSDHHTIYYSDRVVNQFEGIRDVDLACKLAEYFGIDAARFASISWTRTDLVRSIQEAVEEG